LYLAGSPYSSTGIAYHFSGFSSLGSPPEYELPSELYVTRVAATQAINAADIAAVAKIGFDAMIA
jgi:hypothetical protein